MSGRRRSEQLLFLELECERVRSGPARWSLWDVDLVGFGRGDPRRVVRQERMLSVQVPDYRMSSKHARLIRVGERWIVEDCGSKNGTVVNGKPEIRAVLSDRDVIELGRTLFYYREGVRERGDDLDPRLLRKQAPAALRTLSPAFEARLVRLRQAADAGDHVLLRGERGTGKREIARALHKLSKRSGKLVCVSADEPAGELEQRARRAQHGTLLVHRLDAWSRELQKALAAALKASPTRVVSTTTRSLTTKRFDKRLVRMLSEHTCVLPPLRDRREDLGLLVAALLARADAEYEWAIEPDAARALFRHDWPSNVAELERVLRAAAAKARDGIVLREQLAL